MHQLLLSPMPATGRCRRKRSFVSVFVSIMFLLVAQGVEGQTRDDRITQSVDASVTAVLPNHHPQWATPVNVTSRLAESEPLNNLTMVLTRSPGQERDLQTLLADQQNLASPRYHHWLTPVEMGERFGASAHDIAAITLWLQSQGLLVRWVSPSHTFIGFGGTAGTIGHAFHTPLNSYQTKDAEGNTTERVSVATDPRIPAALAPAIQSITGLYTVVDHPLHTFKVAQSTGPRLTVSNGEHFISPADFDSIYSLGGSISTGQTIAIAGESRTNFSDFSTFRQLTLTTFPNPIEVIPTAYGGIDPGPAYAVPPAASVSLGAQSEATLDVDRAGSVSSGVQQTASSAQILLVVATAESGGIEADAQYVVQSTPVPAQVLSISFGACESSVGPAGVNFWDALFKQAAAEGISAFVSSGDSGASGCDADFTTPPASPVANSPNYICSSSYTTCVGGTEFNDESNPGAYWGTANNADLASANGYIPEGGWNEPLNSTNGPQVAASGGGVSSIIPTPAWQTGQGVPAARTGRYTPDVAFSAAAHDAYFGCFAAGGASCVPDAEGSFTFAGFAGTSAAAPAMAGVAALLNAQNGASQGNLTPQLYPLATNVSGVFEDITVASSGVANCALTAPSMCNNSIPGATAAVSAQPGYLVTAGYDLVTGLGSLNIGTFLFNYPSPPKLVVTPATLVFPTQLLSYPASLSVNIQNAGTEAINDLTFAVTGANASDFALANNCSSTLQGKTDCNPEITFTPAVAGSLNATLTVTSSNAMQSPQTVMLTGTGTTTLYTPLVTVSSTTGGGITIGQSLLISVVVTPPLNGPYNASGLINPLGSVVLTTGSYSASMALVNMDGEGSIAMFNIPAAALPLGNDTITVAFTPSQSSAAVFATASGSYTVDVAPVPVPSFTINSYPLTVKQGQSIGNTTTVTASPVDGFVGNVTFTAALTSSPPNAQDPPTLSFGAGSVVYVNNNYPNATLTVATTLAGSNVAHPRQVAGSSTGNATWYATGAASFAWVILLLSPSRLRRWQTALNLLLLLLIFTGGLSACGGGSGGGTTTPPPPANPGTTLGNYTVTLTGTSGTLTATSTVTITVQ